MRYIAFVEAPPAGSRARNWSAYVPDVPGCVATGKSFEDTARMIGEALTLHLAALADDGEPAPAARSMKDLMADPEHAAALMQNGGTCLPQIVSASPPATERVRVNITIEKGLLSRADKHAESEGLTRSRLIEDALVVALEE